MGVLEPFAHAGFADGIALPKASSSVPEELDAAGIDAARVDAIERASRPLDRWPDAIAELYRKSATERLYREANFLFVLGLLIGLSTVVVDLLLHPAMAAQGIVLRVLAVAPITFVGLVAAARGWTRTLAICVGASPIAFAAVIMHLGFQLPPEYAVRYFSGTMLVVGLANLIMPYSLRGLVFLDLAAIATIGGVILFNKGGFAGHVDTLTIQAIVCVATLVIAARVHRLRQANFLLNLRTQIANRELAEANESLRTLSESDPLTGIANRRGFEARFEQAVVAPGEHGRQADMIALMMIDLDHFKKFNDTHGHQSGDYCLTLVAATLEELFEEEGGIVARYGGEEFIAAVRKRNSSEVQAVAEKVREAVAGVLKPSAGSESSLVTASVGVGMAPAMAKLPREELVEMADAALYCGKDQGRNRVEFVEAEIAFG